ncbi:Dhrs13 [Symbiodinium sp. KB8]|nr:Dhrs13 [Symbiodinium sp. KB8]
MTRGDWLFLGLAAAAAILGVHLRGRAARQRLKELLEEFAGREGRVVITGAGTGIGKELARLLRQHPSISVLLGCQHEIEREEGRMRALDEAHAGVLPLELLDLDSVQRFAVEAHGFLKGGQEGLRMLVNNAGFKEKERSPHTKYGVSRTWQVNFLGPFLLTEMLCRLRETDGPSFPASVINVASGHESESNLDEALLEALAGGRETTSHEYADSKRALLLWTSVRSQSLALKGNLFAHAVSPGKVDTRFGCEEIPWWLWIWSAPARILMFRTVSEGALSIAAAGLRKQATSKFGQYFREEELAEDLVIWRMPEKRVSVQLVRWASQVTSLNPRMGGRPLDIGGRSLSITDLVNKAEEDVWSSAERRWRFQERQVSPPNAGCCVAGCDAREPAKLVDGPFMVLQVLSTWNFDVLGHELTVSDIKALDSYMKRCKLGPFRLGRALELLSDPSHEAREELESLRSKARRRLEGLKHIQRVRMNRMDMNPDDEGEETIASPPAVTAETSVRKSRAPRGQAWRHGGSAYPQAKNAARSFGRR